MSLWGIPVLQLFRFFIIYVICFKKLQIHGQTIPSGKYHVRKPINNILPVFKKFILNGKGRKCFFSLVLIDTLSMATIFHIHSLTKIRKLYPNELTDEEVMYAENINRKMHLRWWVGGNLGGEERGGW